MKQDKMDNKTLKFIKRVSCVGWNEREIMV